MAKEHQKEECESCGFETELFEVKEPTYSGTPLRYRLCNLCNETLAGTAKFYPRQYQNPEILKTICYVGNAILQELRRGRGERG